MDDREERKSGEDDAGEEAGECTENLDLILENEALKDDLKTKGMMDYGGTSDLDPKLENAFLKHVMMFEDADKEPKGDIRGLFPPDFEFPPLESMTPQQLAAKLESIYDVLEQHQTTLQLHDGIPNTVVYDYIVNEVLSYDVMFPDPPPDFWHVIDGCGGDCEECFQKNYCETAREILEGETQPDGT